MVNTHNSAGILLKEMIESMVNTHNSAGILERSDGLVGGSLGSRVKRPSFISM